MITVLVIILIAVEMLPRRVPVYGLIEKGGRVGLDEQPDDGARGGVGHRLVQRQHAAELVGFEVHRIVKRLEVVPIAEGIVARGPRVSSRRARTNAASARARSARTSGSAPDLRQQLDQQPW